MGYVFDADHLHELARKHACSTGRVDFAALIAALAEAYPGHIETRQNWLFSLVAGATGIMNVMHGSLSEYLLLFGTSVGTEGFSGRYRIDIHDFILSGELWTYTEAHYRERIVTRTGERVLLPRRQVKGFRMHEDTWVLEYGRGFVPSALPLAVGDSVFSAMDWRTVFKTFWVYGRLVCGELIRGKI